MGDDVYPMFDGALSDTAATGLILGGGAVGCGLLVLGLTVLAIRRGARAEALERQGGQRLRTAARSRSKRVSASTTAVDELGAHDAYPPQPYSAHEPASHKPYSRAYRVPKQDSHAASTNGHRPPDSTTAGLPTTPFPPPDDDS
ncbi:MAG TPA: hypothetical protein VH372_07465 [Actinospica sp.]|nr:hypothetical protein [Actinospica sp.]